MKNKKFVSFFLVAAALLYASTPVLAASKDSFSKTINFKAENEQENIPDFDKEIVKDGQKYTLSGVSVRTLKKTPQKEVQYLTKEVETVVGAQEEYAPPEELQDNNFLYHLSHVEQEPISTPGEGQLVTGFVDYQYPIQQSDVPKTKAISTTDPATGETIQVTAELKNLVQQGGGWKPNYIDIKFYNMDADYFEWNGIQIEGNQEQPLQGYEQELLASVGADRNTSRVIRTYWTSDVYTDENGETCRNARADIEQYVNYYRANYEKRLDKNEVRYVAAYRAEQTVESQTSFIYERAATAKYEKDDNKIVKYIMAGAGILIFVAIVVAILYVIAKKKKETGEKMNSLYVKGLSVLTASGTGGSDPISKFFNIVLELIAPISDQITVIATIVMLVSGLLFMIPLPQQFKRKAGGFLFFLFVGGLIVAGAAQYAAYIESKMSF